MQLRGCAGGVSGKIPDTTAGAEVEVCTKNGAQTLYHTRYLLWLWRHGQKPAKRQALAFVSGREQAITNNGLKRPVARTFEATVTVK